MNGSTTAVRLYLELTAHFIDREIARFRCGEQAALVSFSNVAKLARDASEELTGSGARARGTTRWLLSRRIASAQRFKAAADDVVPSIGQAAENAPIESWSVRISKPLELGSEKALQGRQGNERIQNLQSDSPRPRPASWPCTNAGGIVRSALKQSHVG
jgi:hypothetical protein